MSAEFGTDAYVYDEASWSLDDDIEALRERLNNIRDSVKPNAETGSHNAACVKCGRTDLPIHTNMRCGGTPAWVSDSGEVLCFDCKADTEDQQQAEQERINWEVERASYHGK